MGEETFLQISVLGATPGLSLSIWSGSTFLGALVIADDGSGQLRLSSLPGGNPLPDGFQPVVGDGIHFVSNDDASTVITGTFAIV